MITYILLIAAALAVFIGVIRLDNHTVGLSNFDDPVCRLLSNQ
jgi:hypothetical protein